MFEQALEEQVGAERKAEVISRLPKGFDARDALVEALEPYYADVAVRRIAMKNQVDRLVDQATVATRMVTTLSKVLGITINGELVEPTEDFVKCDYRQMRLMMQHCLSHAESLIRERDSAKSELNTLQQQMNNASLRIKNTEDKASSLSAIAEAKAQANQESIKWLNGLLAAYQDQPIYIVAVIDPVTKIAQRFYSYAEDAIKPSKSLAKLKPLASLKEAQTLRFEVARLLYDRATKVQSLSVNDTVVIMQYSLMMVNTLPELDDE